MTEVNPGGTVEGGSPPTLDLTAETSNLALATPHTKTVEEQREGTRRALAIALLMGLAVVIAVWGLIGVFGDRGDIAAAGAAMNTIFAGVLGLTGTVVGFYFGGADRDSRPE